MILSSLVDYYEILANENAITPLGYSMANVAYALRISQNGELKGVISLKETVQRGKRSVEVPKSMEVPQQVTRTVGVKSNFLCDNSGYILGLDKKGKPERTKQCFDECRALHHEILNGVDSICAKAVLRFLDNWQPQSAYENPVLKDELDEILKGSNLVFYVDGYGYAHEDEAVGKAWEAYSAKETDTPVMQCLVTGHNAPIAKTHTNIKGVRGSQSAGASLVSFNARAYESYGKEDKQGLNAPVSEYAAFAYTTVLNHLLADDRHKTFLGDTTVVYWAKSPKPIYSDFFSFCLNPETPEADNAETSEMMQDKKTLQLIHSAFEKIVSGQPIRDFSDEIDPSTKFYVLGLAPNAARLSVRFYLENSFGEFLNNITKHYQDLEIEHSKGEYKYLPIWRLMLETVSPKSKDKVASPLLSGSVLRSVLTGASYPQALQNSVMVRIRAERDISRGKAAIIKACLLRKDKNNSLKEELGVSLSENSQNRAYVLGRLFAVLEKAQLDANPGINTTIKDRYFTSACATPASIFPILLRLSAHHISKAEYGYVSEKKIGELMDKLKIEENPFPSRLSLDDQGLFILGYYHQQKANYIKKEKEDK